MTREWEPGDVALIEAGCHANRRVALRTGVPSNMGWAYSDVVDGKPRQNWTADAHGTVSVVRPLVVIDPEDSEQAAQLIEYLDRECNWLGMSDDSTVPQMQAALRSLITPPKPDEPTGLGAVVESERGNLYVRAGDGWLPSTVLGQFRNPIDWADINVVRVLSEGVPC